MSAKSTRTGNRLLLLASIVGAAILFAFGTWQLQRLQWKNDLIEKRAKAVISEPITLADIDAGIEHGYDVDWFKVSATGSYRHDLEFHLYHLRDGQIGWRIITPFIVPGSFVALVDRGFVPDAFKAPQSRKTPPATEQQITAFVRVNAGAATMFTPDNDAAANRWYSVDLMAMSQRLPEDLGFVAPEQYAIFLPVLLQLAASPNLKADQLPIPASTEHKIRNNHLQYAITWYSLAIVLVVVAFLFYRSRRKVGEGEDK